MTSPIEKLQVDDFSKLQAWQTAMGNKLNSLPHVTRAIHERVPPKLTASETSKFLSNALLAKSLMFESLSDVFQKRLGDYLGWNSMDRNQDLANAQLDDIYYAIPIVAIRRDAAAKSQARVRITRSFKELSISRDELIEPFYYRFDVLVKEWKFYNPDDPLSTPMLMDHFVSAIRGKFSDQFMWDLSEKQFVDLDTMVVWIQSRELQSIFLNPLVLPTPTAAAATAQSPHKKQHVNKCWVCEGNHGFSRKCSKWVETPCTTCFLGSVRSFSHLTKDHEAFQQTNPPPSKRGHLKGSTKARFGE